jgi:hypothetical protein
MKHVLVLLHPLIALVLGACVDTSPLPFTPQTVDPAPTDGGTAGDGAAAARCRECVVGEGQPCRSEWDRCRAEPRCEALVECLFVEGCFRIAALEQRIACGDPCFDQIGLSGADDPALTLALPINICTQDTCLEACAL